MFFCGIEDPPLAGIEDPPLAGERIEVRFILKDYMIKIHLKHSIFVSVDTVKVINTLIFIYQVFSCNL